MIPSPTGSARPPRGTRGPWPPRRPWSSSSTPTSPSTPTPSPGPWPGSRPTPASPPSSAPTTTTRPPPGWSASSGTSSTTTSTRPARSWTTPARPGPSGPAAALIRREVFLEAGGFDPRLYRRPAIEDIELGYRVTASGHRIVLARDVQATHLKRWTLPDMVRTDIFRRGVPWMLLMKRSKIAETDLNVSMSQRACVAATGLGLLGLVLAFWSLWLLPSCRRAWRRSWG